MVQFDARDAEKKREKWQEVAIEACKQCGQNWMPAVHPPQTLARLFEENTFDLLLIAALQPNAVHPKQLFADFLREKRTKPASVLMLIGPEGDFTAAEYAQAQSHGCRPITLGPIVLRTETAALYCLSVLSYEFLG